MKNNYTFLELFGDIDEKFIYEASRPWKKQVIIKYRLLKTAVAGFILLFLAAGAMTHQEEVKAAWKQFTSWIGTALGLSEDVSSYTDMIGKTITRKWQQIKMIYGWLFLLLLIRKKQKNPFC